MEFPSSINRIQKALHTSRISREFGIDALVSCLEEYLPVEDIAKVRQAYTYGEAKHRGQFRKTGEPYIFHPLAVARILANMRLDTTTIVAAILHDVVEDTDAAREDVAERFGEDVANVVDGVTKLDKAQFNSRAEAQSESVRKLILAMTHDIRVILVKLADRLHNMRTLSGAPAEKRHRVSRETLNIYAPVARRLGMNLIREELEELGFANLHPNRYKVLKRASRTVAGDRRSLLKEIEETLARAVAGAGIQAVVKGRRKNLYSIYRKMERKHRRFLEVFDLYGVRIIAGTVDECYRILGIVHHQYQPITEEFNDFIANPKLNGYQSLHTTVMARGGIKFEVQIRTRDMDQIAESGIAAHWNYKLGDPDDQLGQANAESWLKRLTELSQDARDSQAFIDSLSMDLFPDKVYVFTPKGKIIGLPRGATCVDFAYAVHTELGNRCVAARIDSHLVPLNTQLSSGQSIEVITAKHARPNAAWLNFLRTPKARAGVRRFLRSQRVDTAEKLGHKLLNRAMINLGLSLRKVPKVDLDRALKQMQLEDMDALYTEIGLGNRLAPLVARHFLKEERPNIKGTKSLPLEIEGTEGLVVEYGKCCRPVPGDAIHGQVSAGRGLVVHRFGCSYSARQASSSDRIELKWALEVRGDFYVEIKVFARNEPGTLASISAKFDDANCNIEHVVFPERGSAVTTMRFLVKVKDRDHIANVIKRLRRIHTVEKVERC